MTSKVKTLEQLEDTRKLKAIRFDEFVNFFEAHCIIKTKQNKTSVLLSVKGKHSHNAKAKLVSII